MKRLLLLIVTVFLALGLAACGGDTEDSGSEDANTSTNESDNAAEESKNGSEEQDKSDEKLGVGDTVEVDGVKFTLKNVTTTDERNEFADTDPAVVVKIEYELENNTDDEIPVGGDLEVYDGTGNKMESYPLDNTMDTLQPGKKVQAIEHFGIEEGPIEIYFQPIFSFDDPAIFEAEVK